MNETPQSNIHYLKQLAVKLQKGHDFMAWVLASYQSDERLNDNQLIAQLKATPEMYTRLALCKCPDPNSINFSNQVHQIAQYTNTDPIFLSQIIRQVYSIDALAELSNRKSESVAGRGKFIPGFLAAARDRIDDEETDKPEEKDSDKNDAGGKDVAGQ